MLLLLGILEKMEWKESKKISYEQDDDLIKICRDLLNELDSYIKKQTGETTIRHYRYFTFEVDEPKED